MANLRHRSFPLGKLSLIIIVSVDFSIIGVAFEGSVEFTKFDHEYLLKYIAEGSNAII